MTRVGEPFSSRPVDASPSVFGQSAHGQSVSLSWTPTHDPIKPVAPHGYNAFAVLSPIFALVVPPAGAVLGHLALPQIRRTGEHGRLAAIWGLILGYTLSVGLIAALIAWSTSSGSSAGTARVPGIDDESPVTAAVPPSVVTSVAPVPITPRVKLDLSKVPVGTCAHIEKRDVGDDALDLFATPCEHREGVYTVVARANDSSDCRSTYVAAPPDHSFAVCLSEY